MLRQRPDHLFHLLRQPFADPDALPALGQIAAAKKRAQGAFGPVPVAGGFIRRRYQHGAGISRQKDKIVKVIARKSIFGALPTIAGIAALEKSPRRGDEETILTSRGAAEVVDIEVIDAAADIPPRLSPVETADDSAMFQTYMQDAR